MSQEESRLEKERRKHPRLSVQIWTEEINDNSRYFHLVTNLSTGGFFLAKNLPFSMGSPVNLELDLDGEILPLRGKIIGNYENPVSDHSGAGVQFVDMDEKVKARIDEYLKSL